jgi:hypothetical protein
MKALKGLVLSLLIGSAGVNGSAVAGGIPVIDVAHIAETVMSYQQQLRDYKEFLLQTQLIDSQLVQMITDYQQVLTEYRHYLNQIKGLQHQISAGDWAQIVASIAPNYGSFDPGLLPTMDTSSATYHADTRRILETYDLAPMTTTDAVNRYKALGAHTLGTDKTDFIQEEFTHLNRAYERYANQQEVAAANYAALKKFDDEDRVKMAKKIRTLGDESDLATLHLIASQQNMAMKQRKMLGDIQNQQLQTYEPFSAYANSIKQRAYKKELIRLNKIKGKPPQKAGIDNYADLGL